MNVRLRTHFGTEAWYDIAEVLTPQHLCLVQEAKEQSGRCPVPSGQIVASLNLGFMGRAGCRMVSAEAVGAVLEQGVPEPCETGSQEDPCPSFGCEEVAEPRRAPRTKTGPVWARLCRPAPSPRYAPDDAAPRRPGVCHLDLPGHSELAQGHNSLQGSGRFA